MQTVPEQRPSRNTGLPEEPARTERPVLEKLKVVPKSRTGARESILADNVFRGIVVLCALAVLAVVGLIVFELITQSRLSMSKFGLKFLTRQIWDPVAEEFGALPFIYGTIVSSLLAVIIAVPLSIGTALFLTELCPRKLRAILYLRSEEHTSELQSRLHLVCR